MIIDFHTHAFGDKIAKKAVSNLSNASGGLTPAYEGDVDGLKRCMNEAGADYAVVANIATKPSQQKVINDFAKSIEGDGLIPFGSVHPFAPDAMDELERIAAMGLKGIKLHPDYQLFFVDDERIFKIYEKCVELKLIVLFHAGADIGLPAPVHCTPERLKRALPCFAGGVCVAAHYGGYMMWEGVLEHLCGRDVYFDTSYSYGRIPVYMARALYENHPIERFLFGTDLPWSDMRSELRSLKLILNDEGKYAKVAGLNAASILGLEA